ncbi:MAG: response regulator [Fidelibacterota bacterium]|nr:MAG: response regulator [Candidatus Neomarinimicrobiota bacterium]
MNYQVQPAGRFSWNRLTLSFPRELEKQFHQEHFKKSITQVRLALLSGIGFYAVFGILDALIFPDVRDQLWLIRYAIVIPYVCLVFLFSYTRQFVRFLHVSTGSVVVLAGLGIIVMIIIAPYPGNAVYYAGLLLVFMYGYTFFKIRFIWATLAGLLIVTAYEIAAIWMIETPTSILLSNNFFFLGGNLIGVFASYSIETSSRRDFIQTYLLEDEKKKVDALNEELEHRVEKRTAQVIQANRELRQEIAERVEAEEKYRALFEESRDAVFITTPGGVFLDLNPAGVEMFGYDSKEDILKVDIGRDIYLYPEDRDRFQQLIEAHGHVQDYPIECQRKDGKHLTLLETATAVRDKDNRIVAYQGIMRDVTEQRELERQLIQSQKMESIGLLAGGIAHDLNNILTPITVAIQLLQDKLEDTKDQQLLETLEANASRGADIVKQVLTFARGMEAEFAELQPRKLVEELAGIIQHTFPKNITVAIETQDDLPIIKGNNTQLHQVLLNLCVNARDAMPDGGTLSITAENVTVEADYARLHALAQPGPYVRISVTDTGVGMPPHVVQKVFEPFFTTKSVGKGTGLGLSVVHSIVSGHGGFMDVHSEVGRGATFMVFLPLDPTAGKRPAKAEDIDLHRGHDELILVVDDEESIRLLTKEILESFNYRVLTANNGAEALVLYSANQADIRVVMTDMLMPEMDGPATIRAIRELDPDIPIIATSGLATDEPILADGVEMNVQASIAKPYSAPTLLQTVSRVLKGEPA